MSPTLYHTTEAAAEILEHGFRDCGDRPYGFVGITLTGVFLAVHPANINDGATGDQVLEVAFPDDMQLDDFAIQEEGRAVFEFCVPASIVNSRAAVVRLLPQDELDGIDPW